MSDGPPRNYDTSSSQPRMRNSITTSASGIADSTISFNTYATGITEGSLCLSQFPPPPMTIPSSASPTTERFLPSPARSTFTINATPRTGPSTDQGQPSPSTSIFTIAASPHVNPTIGSTSPIVRPVLGIEKGLPSPAQSTFTITSPVSTGTPPLPHAAGMPLMPLSLNREMPNDSSPPRGPGKTDHLHNSDRRVRPQSPNSTRLEGKLSPYDWHEGSSIISVDAAEERMLSTSFITELLSSTESIKSDQSLRGFNPPSQADVGSLVSEMSYPPASSRHREPVAGSSRISPSSHPSSSPAQGTTSRIHGEDDTTTSLSYGGQADIIQPSLGLTRKVSVLGMAPATLRHIGSTASIPESLHPRSQATYGSTSPLNPRPLEMDRMRPTDIHPIGFPQLPTPERPVSPHFDAGKRSSLRYLRRESAQSSKTVRSHVSSLISVAGQRTVRAARATAEWMRIKPLPPLPTIPNISIYQAQRHQRMEASVPLPQLADRADRLNVMLDAGRLPDGSFRSSRIDSDKDSPFGARASGIKMASSDRRRQSVNVRDSQSVCSHSPLRSKLPFKRPVSRRVKIKLFIGASVLALLALIGIVVGVTVGRKRARSPNCSTNRTGNTCSLDSTCVCTSSNSSQCNPLAQSLVGLIPFVNGQFDSNFTPATVVNALSSSGGSALSNDCAAQARVVDVAPALDSQTVPNRTEWAQGALLWSLVLSQNASAVGKLRDFISKAPWDSLPGDAPVIGLSSTSKFSTTQLGFTFDFAAQTISEPSISFVTDGQPSSAQLAEVGSTARAALDRMYSFASASSTIQTTAMTNYWKNVLGQDPSKFRTFASLLISSPILIPFDANGTASNTSISSLLTNSSTAPFPPPLSCYPGLTPSQFQLITTLETSVFGLSRPATQASFDDSCFADRPIYGVLDILHLRLPFSDSQTRPRQAAILSRDVSPRVVVYNGETLSGLPTSNTSSIPTTDPRQFGTLGHISHVLLDFFKSIPDVNVATQLVNYVLSSQVTPPSNDTPLGRSLDTIPTLEVAVFGSVTPKDVAGVASSFTTPSSKLFFGTDQSLALRDWAIIAAHTDVAWTEFANSPTIVNDNSFTDNAFNAVWNPAYLFFHSNSDVTVTVENITAGFTAVNKFTST